MKWLLSMGGNLELFHLEVFTVEFDELQLPVQPNISVHMPLLSLKQIYLEDHTFFRRGQCLWIFQCFLGLISVFSHSSSSSSSTTLSKYFPPLLQPPSFVGMYLYFYFICHSWNETLTHVTVHQGNGKRRWHRVEKFSLSLKRTWNNIIPSWLTQVACFPSYCWYYTYF